MIVGICPLILLIPVWLAATLGSLPSVGGPPMESMPQIESAPILKPTNSRVAALVGFLMAIS